MAEEVKKHTIKISGRARASSNRVIARKKLALALLNEFPTVTNSYTRNIIQMKETPSRAQRFGLILYLMGNGMLPETVVRFMSLNWVLTKKQHRHVGETRRASKKFGMNTRVYKYYDEHKRLWVPYWSPDSIERN